MDNDRPGTIWKVAHDIGVEFGLWENYLTRIKLEKAQNEAMVTRQMSMSVQPQGAGGSFKTPLPNKFDGKKGDPAFTFLAACNNYRIMKPNAFSNDIVFIQWALQQMEDKAGPWKVRQMMRMDEEIDDQGNPPQELSDWKEFAEYFLTQYGDPGLIEQAKIKWKGGLNQRGKAVDYFEEIKMVLLCLNYQRDSQQTLDQIVVGLKPHIRTHFIGKEWKSLNDMKKEVVPYDAAFWEINTQATGEKTRTFASLSKATSSLHTKGGNLKPLKSRQRCPKWEELRDDSSLRMSLNIVKRISYVSCARRMDSRLLDRRNSTQTTYLKTQQKIGIRKSKRQK